MLPYNPFDFAGSWGEGDPPPPPSAKQQRVIVYDDANGQAHVYDTVTPDEQITEWQREGCYVNTAGLARNIRVLDTHVAAKEVPEA